MMPEKKRKADEADAGDKRKARMEEMALPLMMEAMWAANVVDIEETVASACREALREKESRNTTSQTRVDQNNSLRVRFIFVFVQSHCEQSDRLPKIAS